jgi:hypothetical protein
MLSFSNFGSVDHPYARKVRRATELAKEQAPGLVIDGEMQLATALDGPLRREYFPFSSLHEDANVLIFPGLHSGNLAVHLLQSVGGAVPIGPLLMGNGCRRISSVQGHCRGGRQPGDSVEVGASGGRARDLTAGRQVCTE